MISESKILTISHVSFTSPLNIEFYSNESLNSIKVIKFTKLGIFFVKFTIDSKILPTFHISFASPLNIKFHPDESLNSIEAVKLTKLGIFFVKFIIDSKFINKPPNCMLVFFFLINQAKSSIKVHQYSFPP